MNATMRSLNRGAIVIGAPVGGLLADHLGNRPALWIAIAGLTLQALALTLSPFRHARLG
jgi:MFS family permease